MHFLKYTLLSRRWEIEKGLTFFQVKETMSYMRLVTMNFIVFPSRKISVCFWYSVVFKKYVSLCVMHCVNAVSLCEGQRRTWRSCFSPSIVCSVEVGPLVSAGLCMPGWVI